MPRRLLTPADEQLRARRLRRAGNLQQGHYAVKTANEGQKAESERPDGCLVHNQVSGLGKWYVVGAIILLVVILLNFFFF